jgi:integrase
MGQPPKTPRGIEPRSYRDLQRPGGVRWRYGVRWTDPVTRRRLREEFDTVEDALDFKAHLRLLKRRGQLHDLDRGRALLVDFAVRWLTDYAIAAYPERTQRDYAGVYNRHLLPRVGNLQLRHITPAVVDQLKTDLSNAGVGDPTIRKALAVLSAMLRQAVVWGEIAYNPVKEISKPTARRSKVITALTVDQVEAMIAYLDSEGLDRDRMLVELLAYAAARPQDALALPVGSIGTQRLVYAVKNVDGRVDGERTGLPGAFARAAAAAGVPDITPYFLRHTFASLRIAEQRLSLQEIAAELGHDVDVLAKTYAHVISEYRGQGPISPDDLIREAREQRATVATQEAM